MATPASNNKRQKIDTDSYTQEPDPSVTPRSKSMTSPIISCAQAVLLKMLDYSSLQDLTNINLTCRHLKRITDSDPIQLLICNLLGIIPTTNRVLNREHMTLLEGAINGPLRIYQSRTPESVRYYAEPENGFIKRAWDLMKREKRLTPEDLGCPELLSTIPQLTLAAESMKSALEVDELLNPGLRRRVGQSPSQDVIFPFLLLTRVSLASVIQFTATCKLSPLTFQVALNQLDSSVCTVLANSYREMSRPDPRLLQDLFTDALTHGKPIGLRSTGFVTPEKVMIFHEIGARPGPRSLECLSDGDVRWNPVALKVFDTLLELGAPLTPSVFKKMLSNSLFDIALLEKLLTRFKLENKLEVLPAAFLDATIRLPFDPISYRHITARIALLLRLGCNPDVATLGACRRIYWARMREWARDPAAGPSLGSHFHDPIFAQCTKARHEFFLKCLSNLDLFHLISDNDMREISEMGLKPTLQMARHFYAFRGFEFEVRSMKEWFGTNGYPPNTDFLLTSLKQVNYPSFRLDRALKFYSLGIDSPILPNRPIALSLYFLQMKDIKLHELPDLKNRIQGREWLKKHGFELDFNTPEDLERLLKEFIEIYLPRDRVGVISIILSILKSLGHVPTRAAIDNIFANVPGLWRHPDYRDYLYKNNLLSPAAPTATRAVLAPPVSLSSLPAPAAPPPP